MFQNNTLPTTCLLCGFLATQFFAGCTTSRQAPAFAKSSAANSIRVGEFGLIQSGSQPAAASLASKSEVQKNNQSNKYLVPSRSPKLADSIAIGNHGNSAPSTSSTKIQTVRYDEVEEVGQSQFTDDQTPPLLGFESNQPSFASDLPVQHLSTSVEASPFSPSQTLPIDLPTALRLAGADNLQIAFAAEQVNQACARVNAADVIWVPSLNFGVTYNNHSGRIQTTQGDVIEASRSSLFVGGGAATTGTLLAGGSGGPARMGVDLSLVDVLFEPLAARQALRGAQANQSSTFNDTLVQTANAYQELVRASAAVIVAQEAVDNARELVRITVDFAQAGKGLKADADRAMAEQSNRQRELLVAQESVAVNSAQLAQLLRLDPTTRLIPGETQPFPLQLTDETSDVHGLIAQALSLRPELTQADARIQETCLRTRQEQMRPILPNVYAGFSGGGFGGSDSSDVSAFSDRTDFDMGVIWQLQNMGLGNRARQSERYSVHRQAQLAGQQAREQVAMEVTQSFEQVRFRNQQIGVAESQVRSATDALTLSLDGIKADKLRPIETQQAIVALASARQQYFDSIVDYNLAQFSLLRAIGQP